MNKFTNEYVLLNKIFHKPFPSIFIFNYIVLSSLPPSPPHHIPKHKHTNPNTHIQPLSHSMLSCYWMLSNDRAWLVVPWVGWGFGRGIWCTPSPRSYSCRCRRRWYSGKPPLALPQTTWTGSQSAVQNNYVLICLFYENKTFKFYTWKTNYRGIEIQNCKCNTLDIFLILRIACYSPWIGFQHKCVWSQSLIQKVYCRRVSMSTTHGR